jgi:hypothetical protein
MKKPPVTGGFFVALVFFLRRLLDINGRDAL